jgi:thymidine kinase
MNGRLEVVCGPMFSGKTEVLIETLQFYQRTERVLAIKPSVDDRYSSSHIVSHSGRQIEALALDEEFAVPQLDLRIQNEGVTHVALDEAQFCSESLARYLIGLSKRLYVLVAGLDLTSQGEPFGVMPMFMAYADRVLKIHGVCSECKGRSTRTHRHVHVDPKTELLNPIFVGGAESYQPLCTACYEAKRSP